ncbi:MAG: hypothetical protein QOD13_1282 [Thermoleophilaceae bacterium]|jgi:hypothetical protein|nr:hypothetical protein [Thermoleophilaceae bacterium]
MYFGESAYLLHDGVAGEDVVRAVDAFLGTHNRDAVFDEVAVTKTTKCAQLQVRVVLAAYEARGVVRGRRFLRCPERKCGTLNPADRVAEARAQGDEDPCDGPCGGVDLAAQPELEEVTAYEIISMPTP